jgi:hypothetical protein
MDYPAADSTLAPRHWHIICCIPGLYLAVENQDQGSSGPVSLRLTDNPVPGRGQKRAVMSSS